MAVLKVIKSEVPEIQIEKSMAALKICKSEVVETMDEKSLVIHDNDGNITTNSDQKPNITTYSDEEDDTTTDKPAKKAVKPRKNAGSPRNVRPVHIRRLTRILKKLIRFHKWIEASGVLSVLMQGTEHERSPKENRIKYWAALELAHKGDVELREFRVKGLYDVWTKKNGKMKHWAPKEKYLFQIQYFLYRITVLAHGHIEVETKKDIIAEAEKKKDILGEAELTITYLVNDKGFEGEPIANIVVGLIYYELWYMSSTLKEMKLRKFDTYERSAVSEISGINSYNEFEDLDGQNSVNVGNAESTVQRDSHTSIVDKKKHHMDIDVIPLREETKNLSQEQGLDDEESSGVICSKEMPFQHPGGNTSIFYSRGLQTSLLPLRLPSPSENVEEDIDSHRARVNGNYGKAVNHLRRALYSASPVWASLLPLVQLLLLGDQVEAALEELENISQRSNAELPFRLKANLLEGFNGTNALVLSTCYEDILIWDSTSISAVTNLISLYKNGDYSLERLVEMISLHLDNTSGSCNVWEELALCFLKASQIEDVLESTNSSSEGSRTMNLGISSTVGKFITVGTSRKLWKLRRNWWADRHFVITDFPLEMQAGDWNLLAFKAAGASHLYGPEFDYVKNVCNYLEREKNVDLLLLLQRHRNNSIMLFKHMK
ncbi:uncharacterized protein LOC113348766 [Papaver somniferum]|uniref:uncharacterized protein LOC113348766 n=1 Tax=Papaver somniferum TaxID=3469 RepID=UPI000E70494C|nr:uncharacterized protein LOC113348766 [Papaver somniferum]